jgi:8-oxo-dGTP diphosphatase
VSAGAIRAAGGVVHRRRGSGVEVVVVHRGRYDDWTLPKGKLDRGETHRQAALREVREETGIECTLGPKLLTTRYPTPRGDKRVKWWAMSPVDPAADGPGPDDPDEVTAMEWLPFEEALQRLSYGADRDVLASFAARVGA